MPPGSYYNDMKYHPFLVELCLSERPFWKNILARFFEKYKLTKEEYDEWYFRRNFIKERE